LYDKDIDGVGFGLYVYYDLATQKITFTTGYSHYQFLNGFTVPQTFNIGEWINITVISGYDYDELIMNCESVLRQNKTPGVLPQANSNPFRIGRALGSFWYPFNGYIDDIKVYNRALTTEEILKLCNPNTTLVNDSICEGKTYNENGFSLPAQTIAGDFVHTLTLQSSQGCDSIVILHLTVKHDSVCNTCDSIIITVTNNLSDYVLCDNEQTSEIIFIGSFTNHEWKVENTSIQGLPTGVQTGNFGVYTLENKTNTPLEATIVITPYYVNNGLSCTGQDTSFQITVNPAPSLSNVLADDTLCDGAKTSPIVFTGVATDYEWIASGTVSGLPSGVQTGDFGEYTLTNKNAFEATSIVKVTPKYITVNTVCTGEEQLFKVVVYPHTSIDSITCNKPIMCEEDLLELKVSAKGVNLSYQWYHNNTLLSGETNDRYIELSTNRSHSGDYYVDVTGYCGTVKSITLWVDVRSDNVLVEKWHDVILADNSGYEYFGYQWYKDGNIIHGAIEQFYQEVGGLKGCYSVELTLVGGGKIKSCERCVDKTKSRKNLLIYPNPVSRGTLIHILLQEDNAKVELYTIAGKQIYQTPMNQGLFEMETDPLPAGIYILRLITTNGDIYNEKIIVY
jgi:hypothetical protein